MIKSVPESVSSGTLSVKLSAVGSSLTSGVSTISSTLSEVIIGANFASGKTCDIIAGSDCVSFVIIGITKMGFQIGTS